MPERKSILIVGVGSIGERHLRCFLATGRADIWFCEVNADLSRAVAERYPAARMFEDLNAALGKKPDTAVICTPADLHIPMALNAAKRGVHLLIEKPLSTKLDSVDELVKEVGARKLVAGVAYVFRAHPVLGSMREALFSGRFGEPLQLVAHFGQSFPFFRPAYRNTYYKSRTTGGGAVQDALTHVINMAEWLVGPAQSLVADAAHLALEGVEVEDTVHVLTRHRNALGSFSLNQHQAPNEGTITVACQKGTVRFETHHCRWSWQSDPAGTWHHEPAVKLERDTLFTRQAEQFLDALDGSRPPACSLAEGVQTLRANVAILRSIEDRKWQTIP